MTRFNEGDKTSDEEGGEAVRTRWGRMGNKTMRRRDSSVKQKKWGLQIMMRGINGC